MSKNRGSRLAAIIESKVFDDLGPRRIHHIAPVRENEAEGLVRDVYVRMKRDFQIVPPVSLHSPVPALLAASWCLLRESALAGPSDRRQREAVVAAISRVNACPFCVDVHTTMLRGGDAVPAARRLLRGAGDRIADPRLRAAVVWAEATVRPGDPALAAPPFPARDVPQIAAAAVAFHYINRMVNVFLDDTPFVLPRGLGVLKGVARHVAGSTFARRLMAHRIEPGASLELLPDAPLPEALAWAVPSPPVAGALARMSAAVEAAGRAALPGAIRAAVDARLAEWNGERMPMGRGWVDDVTSGLDPAHRPPARLAFLTALASHHVDAAVVARARDDDPSDARLVGLTSWAAWAAARRIGEWIVGER